MFKAAIKVASHSAISNKDRKKLKKDLCKNFPTDIIDIVFINSDEISATKLQNGPITIYSDEQAPLFIDSTGEGDFFPSLYAVNFYPDLCRNLFLKEGVEAFIFKGANLMWAGVDNIDALPSDLNADDVVALRRASDKKVVAVGALACDVESVKGKSADGVACYILHMEGDNLWGCGSKTHTPAKYDRKVQEEKEQEALKQLEKKEKKRHQEEDEEEEDDIDNFAGFIKHKNEGMVVDMSKGSKLKHMPKELKGTQEAKAPKGGKAAKEEPKGKGGKDKDEADHKGGKGGKDKDDKKGDKKGAKDDKKGGKGKDDDKKGKKGGKADKGKKKDEASDEEEEMEEASEPEDKKGGDDEEQNESAGQSGDEGSGSEDDKKTKGGKGKAGKAKGKEEKKKEDEPVVTKEQMKQMDDMIMESFLNACKMSITEKDLPIECGKLLTDHIIKCKPQDDFDIDLKISSHKKIGKFLQQLQKEKLLTYEEASKKNPVPKVTKIEFHHKKIADWTPTLTGKALEKRIKDQEKEDGANQNSWKVTVEISKLYKPNDAVKAFLENSAAPLSKVEAEKRFMTYLKLHKLLEGDQVVYNDELFSKFGIIEEEASDDDEEEGMEDGSKKVKAKTKKGERQAKVSRKRLVDVFLKCLAEVHEIKDKNTGATEVKGSPFKDVQIVAEKAHNKFITRISGLEPFKVEVDKLGSYFQNKFATSATVSELPGKGNSKEITIQGTFIDELKDFLVDEMGIPEDLIKLNNKVEKKKNKGGGMKMQ